VDFHTRAVHVRRGKGGKARVTYVGAKTRHALLRWSPTQPEAVSSDSRLEVQGAAKIDGRRSRSFQRAWGGGQRRSAIFPLTPSRSHSHGPLSCKSGAHPSEPAPKKNLPDLP